MKAQIRDRLVLPFAIPLGVLAAIAVITIGFSRVLLGVPAAVATAIAIMAAISVLAAGAVLVLRPRIGAADLLFMIGAAAVPFVFGGAVAVGVIEVSEEEEHEAAPFAVDIAAENIAFDQEEVTVPAGRPLTITFENRDTVQHNVAVFDGDSGDAPRLFAGEVFAGPESMPYDAPAFEAGSYFFWCDVHPSLMTGTLVVEEETETPEVVPQPGAVEVTAENIAFDTDTLTLSAEGTTITFENRDTVPHNIAIFRGEGPGGEKVFTGELITAATESYEVSALEAGNYYFHCDVHPNMNGTAEVR
jgi:plastocyanin